MNYTLLVTAMLVIFCPSTPPSASPRRGQPTRLCRTAWPCVRTLGRHTYKSIISVTSACTWGVKNSGHPCVCMRDVADRVGEVPDSVRRAPPASTGGLERGGTRAKRERESAAALTISVCMRKRRECKRKTSISYTSVLRWRSSKADARFLRSAEKRNLLSGRKKERERNRSKIWDPFALNTRQDILRPSTSNCECVREAMEIAAAIATRRRNGSWVQTLFAQVKINFSLLPPRI